MVFGKTIYFWTNLFSDENEENNDFLFMFSILLNNI
jgi:hypothetical protein